VDASLSIARCCEASTVVPVLLDIRPFDKTGASVPAGARDAWKRIFPPQRWCGNTETDPALLGDDDALADADVASKVSQLANVEDPIARQAYFAMAGYLAEGIANLFNVVDPEAIIVVGGLVEGKPWFIAEVEKRVAQMPHFGKLRSPRIQVTTAVNEAGVLGAAVAAADLDRRLIFANLCGFWIGEWKLTQAKERRWMALGLIVC
jgi:ROK family